MDTRKRTVPLDLLDRVRAIVERDGQRKVSARWGINRYTLASALAGYQVQAGTIGLLTLGLQKEEGVDAKS